jgi:hypothetical protein
MPADARFSQIHAKINAAEKPCVAALPPIVAAVNTAIAAAPAACAVVTNQTAAFQIVYTIDASRPAPLVLMADRVNAPSVPAPAAWAAETSHTAACQT